MIKEIKILIIDSDPAEINERKKANFGMTTGEGYASALRACRDDLQITIVCPYDGDPLPDPTEYEGVIFTGSAVGWSTDAPQEAPLVAAMRRCFDAKRPVMGSCNGMQLAATVLTSEQSYLKMVNRFSRCYLKVQVLRMNKQRSLMPTHLSPFQKAISTSPQVVMSQLSCLSAVIYKY